ncbi:hypothetical protein C8J56DRAFT_888094 [Mycena floridula]|nr:hypothetical protein C8J56DRAFT_888094 [Mycena floridula]
MIYSTSTIVAVAVVALQASNTLAAPTGAASSSLEARGYDNELEARDLDLELDARGVSDIYNKAKDKATGMTKEQRQEKKAAKKARKAAKKQGGAAAATTPADSSAAAEPAVSARDFDEFELEARDFDEAELEARVLSIKPSNWGLSKQQYADNQNVAVHLELRQYPDWSPLHKVVAVAPATFLRGRIRR